MPILFDEIRKISQKEEKSNKGIANGYASLDFTSKIPTNQLATGTATSDYFLRGDRVWATAGGAGTPSDTVVNEQSFGSTPIAGTSTNYSRGDHTHGTPTNPVTGHESTYNHALLHSNSLDHSNANDPSSDQKNALAGTNGVPSSTNKYVTNSDTRNSDARTPLSHSHTESDVTNLVTDLGNKLASSSFSGLSKISVGTSQPTSPSIGDLWVDTN